MIAEIDGSRIRSEADFHDAIAGVLGFPAYYGKNLAALWDVLSTDIERPVQLVWRDSSSSATAMPERFAKIVELLRRVEHQDSEWKLPCTERFELVLK